MGDEVSLLACKEGVAERDVTSVLAFLALLMCPVPFLFYFYGRKIRRRCRYTIDDS